MKAKIWNKNGWITEINPTELKNKFSDLRLKSTKEK